MRGVNGKREKREKEREYILRQGSEICQMKSNQMVGERVRERAIVEYVRERERFFKLFEIQLSVCVCVSVYVMLCVSEVSGEVGV